MTCRRSQYNLQNKLQIDITFNPPEAVILAGTGADLTKGTDYAYSVKDLRMEYDIINEPSMSLDVKHQYDFGVVCLLYTSPSPRDGLLSRMPSSA